MSKRSGVTYIRIPVQLFELHISSAHELAILALAVGFGPEGLRMSNAELANLLRIDRRHIPRILGRLVRRGALTSTAEKGRRILYCTDTKVVTPADTKMVTGGHQSGDEVTPKLPCPSITEVTEATERPARTSSPEALEDDALFRRFWSTYPRKVAKVDARKAWGKLRPDAALAERIIAGVESYAATEQWRREGGRYIPNPATFLNKRRWEDEIQPATVGAALGCAPCDEDEAVRALQSVGLWKGEQ